MTLYDCADKLWIPLSQAWIFCFGCIEISHEGCLYFPEYFFLIWLNYTPAVYFHLERINRQGVSEICNTYTILVVRKRKMKNWKSHFLWDNPQNTLLYRICAWKKSESTRLPFPTIFRTTIKNECWRNRKRHVVNYVSVKLFIE